jgi:RNA polymerase sigma-70 factor (ECF subfamily)
MPAGAPEPRDVGHLVQRASAGDAPSIEALLVRYLPRLRAFVRLRVSRTIRQRESSSDLVQTVCREVLKNGGSYSYEGEEKFLGWLFKTALNKIIDHHRYFAADKRAPQREAGPDRLEGVDYSALRSKGASPSQVAMGNELAEHMEAAFDQLPEEYREVITLSRIVGLPHAEIARAMERSEGAVRMLLSRALVAYVAAMDKVEGQR